MKYSLAERNMLLADNTRTGRRSDVDCEESIESNIRDGKFGSTDFMDFTQAISGDDLARIAAFEPKREPSLWADVTTHGLEAAA